MVAGAMGPEGGADMGSKADARAIARTGIVRARHSSGGLAAPLERALWILTLRRAGLLADRLAKLVREPQLHAYEGLPPLLRQLAPRFWPGQHVAHTAL